MPAAKYPKHEKAVAWATGELGVTEHPLGSNRGPRVEHYQSFDWIPGGGYPWCVAYLQAAWAEGAGYPLPWKTAGAYNLGDLARQAGWTTTVGKLIPGDLCVWNIGAGHASIFLSLKAGKVTTIDGNSADRVIIRTRPATLLRNAIHVPEKATPIPPVTRPVFEVVTSESGSERIIYVSGPKAVTRKLAEILRRFGTVTIRRRKP